MVNDQLRPITLSGGVKSISDDDLCATCKNCQYVPGEMSGCSLNWPGNEDGDGYVQECTDFKATSDSEDRPVQEIEFDNQTVSSLTKHFLATLRRKVGDDVYQRMVALNKAETDPSICHSHDFIDANMVMAKSFADVTGTAVDVRSSSQSLLWSRSWAQAVRDMKQ